MNAIERDDIIFFLNGCMKFYGKNLEPEQLKYWLSAFQGKAAPPIVMALQNYPSVGRYAPKPIDILELAGTYRQQTEAKQEVKDIESNPCPPGIAAAWMWFLSMITQDSENFSGAFGDREVDESTAQQYIELVNQEAFKANQPDAIPDEYKTKIWEGPF